MFYQQYSQNKVMIPSKSIQRFGNVIIIIKLYILIQSTMNSFGVSLFKNPEQFISFYLGMKTHTQLFLDHLERVLHRTKSPPLALTYTFHFLSDKTEEELSLDVIRFVSQLADVSPGVSMGSSLHGILSQSSFLTELRHSLTHKTMVKGTILLLARRLILEELQQKYWKVSCNKLRQTYRLSIEQIKICYFQLFNQKFEGDLSWLIKNVNLQFFIQCSNYEYKEHITTIIQHFKNSLISSQFFSKYFNQVSFQKQTIFLVLIFKNYLENNVSIEHFENFVLKEAKTITEQHFNIEIVRRQLFKSYFLRYLKHANNLFTCLPDKFKRQIEDYWAQKEKQTKIKIF